MTELAAHINQPRLPDLTRRFLYEQRSGHSSDDVDIMNCPEVQSKVNVFHSAIAMFYAPSDNSGIRGMHRERIRSTPSWYGYRRRDMVVVVINDAVSGFRGLSAARVELFFSFTYHGSVYPCALVHWFDTYNCSPDSTTGMWIVRPSFRDARQRQPHVAVIHIDTLLRGIHLLPVYGPNPILVL